MIDLAGQASSAHSNKSCDYAFSIDQRITTFAPLPPVSTTRRQNRRRRLSIPTAGYAGTVPINTDENLNNHQQPQPKRPQLESPSLLTVVPSMATVHLRLGLQARANTPVARLVYGRGNSSSIRRSPFSLAAPPQAEAWDGTFIAESKNKKHTKIRKAAREGRRGYAQRIPC